MGVPNEKLAAARALKYEPARLSAMTKLLPHLPQQLRAETISEIVTTARNFENPYLKAHALADLLPNLGEADLSGIVVEAVQSARNITSAGSRATVFARLAPLLPEGERAFALIEAWAGSSSKEADSRGVALIEFIQKHPQLEQIAILEEALDSIQRLGDSKAWLDVIRPLAKYVPHPMLESVITCSAGISATPNRVESLATLASELPQQAQSFLLEQTLAIARSAEDSKSRSGALCVLVPFLPPSARIPALSEALEAVRTIRPSYFQSRALEELLPLLPQELLEQSFEMAAAFTNENERISSLVNVATLLPESLHPHIVETIRRQKDETIRLSALFDLARIKPKAFLDALRTEIERIADAKKRAAAIIRLSWLSPEEERDRVLDQAVGVALTIADKPSQARALIEIAANFAGEARRSVFMQALSAIQSIEEQSRQSNALRELAAAMAPQLFTSFLEAIRPQINAILPVEALEAIAREKEAPRLHGYAEQEERRAARMPGALAISFDRTPYVQNRTVNTGFSNVADPGLNLDPNTSLAARESYYFWVYVGLPDERSIETVPTSLPIFSERVTLKVAIVPIQGDMIVEPATSFGELDLETDGSTTVVSQSQSVNPAELPLDQRKRRLFFSVRPAESGLFRFRCNIYYEHVLVQSRLISARVTECQRPFHGALRSELDYTLSGTLNPSHLRQLTPHQVSLLLVTGEKTLSFSFFGSSGDEVVKREATFDVLELQDSIVQARGVLRRVAWGDEQDWQPTKSYRYAGKVAFEQFKDDLISLAVRGYRLYDAIVDRLMGSRDKSQSLERITRSPGLIQIAIPQSPRQHIPAALFYDYRLETGMDRDAYEICTGFLQALRRDVPLEESDCFQGKCPSRNSSNADHVVCPSGFWGFRHELGMPLSVASSLDSPAAITYQSAPQMTVGVSTDPAFTEWPGHERAIQQLRKGLGWSCATTRSDLFRILKKSNPHIVYLYCHGGMSNGIPYIQIGPASEYVITRENLRNEEIDWHESWPLVFINGCQTAALEPSKSMELVSACIQSSASGVVGTEITLFEPLACAFAEEFMRRFLMGVCIGKAIRGARLALLKAANPLGLAYIPYALASLSLIDNKN